MVRIGNFLICTVTLLCCSCSLFGKPKPPAAPQGPSGAAAQTPSAPQKANLNEPAAAGKPDGSLAYKKDELSFHIKADSQLNRFHGNSHALYLCIYQLKDPNAFNQQAEEKDGLAKLLECTRFDASVVNAKRFVVQPGTEINDIRDRAEGARFIGIATGYYGAEKVKATQLNPIPPNSEALRGSEIGIDLGPNEIERVTVK